MIEQQSANQIISQQHSELQVHLQLTLKTQGHLIKILNDNKFITRTSFANGYCFQCIDLNNNILAELPYSSNDFDNIIAVTESQAIILQTNCVLRCSYIIVWNLTKNDYSLTTVKWMEGIQWMGNIFYFRESAMFCYWEISRKNRRKYIVRISYYRIQELKSGICCHVYQTQEFSNQKNMPNVLKLNEKSMIGLIGGDSILKDGKTSVSLYEFEPQKQTVSQNKLKLDLNHILNPRKLSFLSMRIKDIWEIEHNLFYFQIQTFVDVQKYKQSQMDLEFSGDQQRYHTFYYNFDKKQVTVGKINIAQAHRLQFVNKVRSVQHKEQQNQSLQARLQKQKPRAVGVPIYYVESKGKSILTMNHGITNIWDQRLEWQSYSKGQMFRILHNAEHRQIWQITIYQFPEEWWHSCQCGLNTVSVHWLAQIIKECDDDLLEFVYKLL